MRILCLTDFALRGPDRWLWNYLPPGSDEVDFCYPARRPADRYAGWGKLLAYYPAYSWLAARALLRTRRMAYDAVMAFEGKNGLPLGFIRRVTGQHRPKLVILFFSVKGVMLHFPALARFAMQAVDCIIVPSLGEISYYSRLLHLPEEKIAYCPIGMYDFFSRGAASAHNADGRYVFAGGRSDRDYRTFAQAVSGLKCQAIVNTRPFGVSGISLPANLKVNDMMPPGRLREVMAGAEFVVVPLRDVPHAAGLSQVVLAMSAGKAVVATCAGGVADYVQEGENGMLVEPSNVADLQRAMQHLLDHPDEAKQMGLRGRARYEQFHTFPRMAETVRGVLEDVCSQS